MCSRYAALVVVLAVGVAACGESASTSSVVPSSLAGTSAVAGTWVGVATDSSGTSMGMSTGQMGMGMPGGAMGDMTWQLTQTGGTFAGTVRFAGHSSGGQMRVSGTMNGRAGTFTLTMPMGTMPMAGCSGLVTGTFDMDDMLVVMQGVYTGSTTCFGRFDRGQMRLTRK